MLENISQTFDRKEHTLPDVGCRQALHIVNYGIAESEAYVSHLPGNGAGFAFL